MAMNDFIQQEQLRGSLYHLLSRAYRIPDVTLQEAEMVNQLQAMLEEHHPVSAEQAGDMADYVAKDLDLDALVQDHMALFIGPQTLLAPPYGSLYLENKGQIMGESTRHAMKYYEAAGLHKGHHMHEPDDHIRIELEFMFYLISRVIECCQSGKLEEAEGFARLQLEFLERHLAAWVRPFTQQMERHAATPFYKALARMTDTFVAKDAREDSRLMLAELQALRKEMEE